MVYVGSVMSREERKRRIKRYKEWIKEGRTDPMVQRRNHTELAELYQKEGKEKTARYYWEIAGCWKSAMYDI